MGLDKDLQEEALFQLSLVTVLGALQKEASFAVSGPC